MKRSLLLLAVAAAAWQAPSTVNSARMEGMRLSGDGTTARFVMDLNRPVRFQDVYTLPDPYRVVIDLPEVVWARETGPQAGGFVTGVRFGHFRDGTSRVVLDLERPVRISRKFSLKPSRTSRHHRLVVDLAAVDRETFVREYRARKPPVRQPPPKAPPSRRPKHPVGKKLIVIDPGHGGVDPGAISRSGRHEKHVVLAHARELRRQLLGTGKYDVAMTRSRDVYIPLRGRVRKARSVGADLFLSLHADSIRRPSVRGASVYTLSERASDKEAAALAARENKSDLVAGIDLDRRREPPILIDMAQRLTTNESARFAGILVEEVGRVRKMLRNTHRFAGFAVLKAPDVPAVLVELGYLSNRDDERLLLDGKARRRVTTAIVRAINRYFALPEVRKVAR